LHAAGVRTWPDVLARSPKIPKPYRRSLLAECCRCLAALEAGNVRYFVDRFASEDQWRILAHFVDEASFFDIETTGLEYGASITVIVCWHRGRLLTFVEHENLDEFLEFIDEATLLVSFNGSSFDVPRVLDTFHIAELPCPHIDLRWSCYHRGLRGPLKEISRQLGIMRPVDLQTADGAVAVELWERWTISGDRAARDYLVRYCAADVLLSVMVANRFAGRGAASLSNLWQQLPTGGSARDTIPQRNLLPAGPSTSSPIGMLTKLRARRRGVA
jgi:uncharacterized protein YprB with RNaseH-like and TPR domain